MLCVPAFALVLSPKAVSEALRTMPLFLPLSLTVQVSLKEEEGLLSFFQERSPLPLLSITASPRLLPLLAAGSP